MYFPKKFKKITSLVLILSFSFLAFTTYYSAFFPIYTEWYGGLSMRFARFGYNTIKLKNESYQISYETRPYPLNLLIKDYILTSMVNDLGCPSLVYFYAPSDHSFNLNKFAFYSNKPPGTALFLSIFYSIFGYEGFRIAFGMIGACLFILFFMVSKEILRDKILSFIISFFLVFNKFMTSNLSLVQNDVIALLITLTFVYSFLLGLRKKRWHLFLLSGLVAGFLFGVKDFLILILFPAIFLILFEFKDNFYRILFKKKLETETIKIIHSKRTAHIIFLIVGFLVAAFPFFWYNYWLNQEVILKRYGWGFKDPNMFNIKNFYRLRPDLMYTGEENVFPPPFYFYINFLILFGYIMFSFIPLGIVSIENKSHTFFLLSSFLIVFLFLSYFGAPDKEVIRLFLPLFFIPTIFSVSGMVSFLKKPNTKKIFIFGITFLGLLLSIRLINNLHFENEELYSNIMGENITSERESLINQISISPKLFILDIRFSLSENDNTFLQKMTSFINETTENNSVIIVPIDPHLSDYLRQFDKRYTAVINLGHARMCDNNFFDETNCGYYFFEKSLLWFLNRSFPVYYIEIQHKRPIEVKFQNQLTQHLNQSFSLSIVSEFENARLFRVRKSHN